MDAKRFGQVGALNRAVIVSRPVLGVVALAATLCACTGGGSHGANPSRPSVKATRSAVLSSTATAYPATGSLLSTYFGPAPPTALRIFGSGVNYPRVGHDGAGSLVVVTTGSGSCPSVPSSIRISGPNTVVMKIGAVARAICTSDLRITNNVVDTPGLDTTRLIRVVLRFGSRTLTGTLPVA